MALFRLYLILSSLFGLILTSGYQGSARIHLAYGVTSPNVPASELSALYALYDSTNGSTWTYNLIQTGTQWNFSQPNPNPCTGHWEGVSCNCDTKSCTVLAIGLNSHNLRGRLPSAMGNLTNLGILDLNL
ncbi:hypothetical protein EON65_24770 [archaeon]|nr:MAG: hypothetical protein EON65_24770 [archaeon]